MIEVIFQISGTVRT